MHFQWIANKFGGKFLVVSRAKILETFAYAKSSTVYTNEMRLIGPKQNFARRDKSNFNHHQRVNTLLLLC